MNLEKLQKLVEYYISNYDYLSGTDREGYKWEAMQTFQDAYLMDGPVMDFPARLKQATSMAGNLLTDSHVYARKEILETAKKDAAATSLLFKQLAVDVESGRNVTDTIRDFQCGLAEILPDHQAPSHKDCRAISVYMSFLYPERFYPYKYHVATAFMKYVEYERIHKKGDAALVEEYFNLASEVHDYLIQNDVLMALAEKRNQVYPGCDPEYHLLTQDVIYSYLYMSKSTIAEGPICIYITGLLDQRSAKSVDSFLFCEPRVRS